MALASNSIWGSTKLLAGLMGPTALKWGGGLALGGAALGAINPNNSMVGGGMGALGSTIGWGVAGALGGAAWGAGRTLYKNASLAGKSAGGIFEGGQQFLKMAGRNGSGGAYGLMGRRALKGAIKYGKWGLAAGAIMGMGKALLGSNQPIMPI